MAAISFEIFWQNWSICDLGRAKHTVVWPFTNWLQRASLTALDQALGQEPLSKFSLQLHAVIYQPTTVLPTPLIEVLNLPNNSHLANFSGKLRLGLFASCKQLGRCILTCQEEKQIRKDLLRLNSSSLHPHFLPLSSSCMTDSNVPFVCAVGKCDTWSRERKLHSMKFRHKQNYLNGSKNSFPTSQVPQCSLSGIFPSYSPEGFILRANVNVL